jgi:hypothetical protein
MKRSFITLCLSITISFVLIFFDLAQAQRVPPNIWQNADMSYSFMQILSPNSIQMRNILLKEKDDSQNFYRQNFSLKGGNLTAIAGTLQKEGTNQRLYIIARAAIDIDGSIDDWNGIEPAFLDNSNDNVGDSGLDIEGIYLARDNDYLYVMMTLNGPILSYDPGDPPATYSFQARNFPEDDSFSFYTSAHPRLGLGNAFLTIHYRARLTDPDPTANPGAVTIKFYTSTESNTYAAYGLLAGNRGFVEWKTPLADFPIEAIEGKYVDGFSGRPPLTPGRYDSTETVEGVRIVVEP